MSEAVDAIMQVMAGAFDPAYGEAWNRRQVENALAMPHTWYLLADGDGAEPADLADTVGFILARGTAGEEELLLIAVLPQARRRGVGASLLQRYIAEAGARGTRKLFLEMRDGNAAQELYRQFGFKAVGLRRDYYRAAKAGPIDAITFALSLR